MRPRMPVAVAVAAAAAAVGLLAVLAVRFLPGMGGLSSALTGDTGPQYLHVLQDAPPPALLDATRRVSVTVDGTYAWALLDRKSGQLTGSDNAGTWRNTTESMIKTWLVSDMLRRASEQGQQPTDDMLATASRAIRHSDDNAAQALYNMDGRDASIKRLFTVCGLKDSTIGLVGWWSYTMVTADDAARLGECIVTGRAAGPRWTPWLLNEMRNVQGGVDDQQLKTGGGHWGIIDALPPEVAAKTSIKNGWTLHNDLDAKWHVNCLALVDEDYVLAVLVDYARSRPLQYGADVCRSVTQQLMGQAAG